MKATIEIQLTQQKTIDIDSQAQGEKFVEALREIVKDKNPDFEVAISIVNIDIRE